MVVPAFNEQKLLAGSLKSIRESVAAAGLKTDQWELIVCDNASTDDTPRIAGQAGARVVHESHRQIARARNTGAATARGQWLLFVDADTWPNPALMRATLAAMESGEICAGGARVSSADSSAGVKLVVATWNLISGVLRLAAGGSLFCRRQAFLDLGGFNEELYAAEEIDFCRRLSEWGRTHGQRLIILSGVEFRTSLRKMELYGRFEIIGMFLRAVIHPSRMLRDKKLLGMWYDGRR